MKKMAFVVALALAIFVGITGCDTGTGSDPDSPPAVSYSEWWVKGSFDGWKNEGADRHYFTIDELNANKLTYEITGLYAGVDISFVVQKGPADPADTFQVLDTTTVTVDGTAIALVTKGTAGAGDIKFTPLKSSYTITVDITDPAAPTVALIGGTDAVLPITNAVLASNLKIKGDAFSIGWTETAGTYDAETKTVSYDVTVAAKENGYGFQSMDGFIRYNLDVSTLLKAGDKLAAPVELLTAEGAQKLIGATKMNSIYTFAVTIDVTKAVNAGRYTMNVTLKTLSETNWAFEAPAAVRIKGTFNDWALLEPDSYEAGIATWTITATETATKWGFNLAAEGDFWNGFDSWVIDATGLEITNEGNATFTSEKDKKYIVTADFSTPTYISDGTPTVKVVAVAP